MVWAILSGVEGNLAAYKAVLKDIEKQPFKVDELYILGDLIGPRPESEELVQYIRQSRRQSPSAGRSTLAPQICIGWWEEQAFNLHGSGTDPDGVELREHYGIDAIEQLWKAVSRESAKWLRGLDFGFFELDCLLIHGSTSGVNDELTPKTNPLTLLDRLLRADANALFCGRSGLAFQYQLPSAQITSTVETLGSSQTPNPPQQLKLNPRQIIGVGNVGRLAGYASYTLYHPGANTVQFQQVNYSPALKTVSSSRGKGFSN
ncbi:MAG: metallophosphoesterase family protein [Cyanobacteria bacterium J06598_3]